MITNFKIFNSGSCVSLKKFAIKTASWKKHEFPALFALIQHSQYGNILYDTGHSKRFFELTKKFPMKIYRWLIHVKHDEHQDASYQLEKLGIKKEDIHFVIISHFHADHIGALRDFPNAKFIYLQEAYDAVKNLNSFSALRSGFISGLIPNDFLERSQLINSQNLVELNQEYFPFKTAYKIFDDESILAVNLPGHAEGHLGILLDTNADKIFLIGDACWSCESYLNLNLPHFIASLTMSNKKCYKETIHKLYQLTKLSPHIKIIPSHCNETWDEIKIHHDF